MTILIAAILAATSAANSQTNAREVSTDDAVYAAEIDAPDSVQNNNRPPEAKAEHPRQQWQKAEADVPDNAQPKDKSVATQSTHPHD